jgi:hypothetical protein
VVLVRGSGARQRQRLQDYPARAPKRGGCCHRHRQLRGSTGRLRSASASGMDDGFPWQPRLGLHGHGSFRPAMPGCERLFLSPPQFTRPLLRS